MTYYVSYAFFNEEKRTTGFGSTAITIEPELTYELITQARTFLEEKYGFAIVILNLIPIAEDDTEETNDARTNP